MQRSNCWISLIKKPSHRFKVEMGFAPSASPMPRPRADYTLFCYVATKRLCHEVHENWRIVELIDIGTIVLFMLRNIHGDYPVGVLLLCTGRESR